MEIIIEKCHDNNLFEEVAFYKGMLGEFSYNPREFCITFADIKGRQTDVLRYIGTDNVIDLPVGVIAVPYLLKEGESGFTLSEKAMANIIQEELGKSCFIPLLDSGAPHESGNYVTRTLVQQEIISQRQSVFINRLPEIFRTGKISKLVIVDDCVGSGQQLSDFWQEATIPYDQGVITLQALCAQHNVEAHYLTLFGYDKNILRLQEAFDNLTIHCVRMLTDGQRVFSDNAYIWKDAAERDEAEKLFAELCQEAGIPLLGYRDLDFAFVMHRTIPDWTLPLFWKETANWKLLMRRKNSHD